MSVGDVAVRSATGAEVPRYPYVHVDVPSSATDDVAAELFELGAAGVEQRDETTLAPPDATSAAHPSTRPPDNTARASHVTLVASFATEQDAHRVARALQPRYAARVQFVVGDQWRDGWRQYFKPVRIGARLLVRPSWEVAEPWPGEVVLTLDPGQAFGSGTHETTRLVLREIDRYVRGGEHVLDVGCGSGILSVAGLLLGAQRARAVDIEPQAVEATRDNARLNRVASRLSVSTTPVERIRKRYELVVANIEAGPLIRHAEAIAARVAPGGRLVLSGVLEGQQDEVRAAYGGLQGNLLRRDGEWVALVLRKPL